MPYGNLGEQLVAAVRALNDAVRSQADQLTQIEAQLRAAPPATPSTPAPSLAAPPDVVRHREFQDGMRLVLTSLREGLEGLRSAMAHPDEQVQDRVRSPVVVPDPRIQAWSDRTERSIAELRQAVQAGDHEQVTAIERAVAELHTALDARQAQENASAQALRLGLERLSRQAELLAAQVCRLEERLDLLADRSAQVPGATEEPAAPDPAIIARLERIERLLAAGGAACVFVQATDRDEGSESGPTRRLR